MGLFVLRLVMKLPTITPLRSYPQFSYVYTTTYAPKKNREPLLFLHALYTLTVLYTNKRQRVPHGSLFLFYIHYFSLFRSPSFFFRYPLRQPFFRIVEHVSFLSLSLSSCVLLFCLLWWLSILASLQQRKNSNTNKLFCYQYASLFLVCIFQKRTRTKKMRQPRAVL